MRLINSRSLATLCTLILLSVNCLGQNYSKKKILKDLKGLPGFHQAYVGFQLYDPVKDKVMASHLEDKFMTPASNTKLFTFYAGLKLLGDAIPAMNYLITGDSLIFWGTGSPLLLHPEIPDNSVLKFLSGRSEKLFYWSRYSLEERFGPGWSWDDFRGYYSAEKSSFPIYGNSTTTLIDPSSGSLEVIPKRLEIQFRPNQDTTRGYGHSVRRSEFSNDFEFKIGIPDSVEEDPVEMDTLIRPFRYSDDLFRKLLSDTLKKAVRPYLDTPDLSQAQLMFGLPIDTLYKNMLQPSDNLLAEQILMLSSGLIKDTLSTKTAIDYMQNNHFQDWQDELIWVDGSGLSRYNMFTPRTIVQLLKQLRLEIGEERLFKLLPAGGISGTIENWYAGEDGPFVFAKTGTISNNHCLSGYVRTKKGRTLIFTFMVNHYTHSTNRVRESMEIMLRKIRNAY